MVAPARRRLSSKVPQCTRMTPRAHRRRPDAVRPAPRRDDARKHLESHNLLRKIVYDVYIRRARLHLRGRWAGTPFMHASVTVHLHTVARLAHLHRPHNQGWHHGRSTSTDDGALSSKLPRCTRMTPRAAAGAQRASELSESDAGVRELDPSAAPRARAPPWWRSVGGASGGTQPTDAPEEPLIEREPPLPTAARPARFVHLKEEGADDQPASSGPQGGVTGRMRACSSLVSPSACC